MQFCKNGISIRHLCVNVTAETTDLCLDKLNTTPKVYYYYYYFYNEPNGSSFM